MAPLIINNAYVHSHPLWGQCASTLQDISNRDYPNPNYFKSLPRIDALDLDSLEKSQHKHAMECTGDAVMGIALEKVGNNLENQYLLLVELRMGYTNGDHLDLMEIKNKVEHSKDIINANGVSRVYPEYYFIFTDAEAPQANNKIKRKANEIGRMTNYKVLSVSGFKNVLLDPAKLPYKPKHQEKAIVDSFLATYLSSDRLDMDKFGKAFNFWLGEIRNCKLRNDIPEANYLSSIVKREIVKAQNMISNKSSDAFVELEIMEELV